MTQYNSGPHTVKVFDEDGNLVLEGMVDSWTLSISNYNRREFEVKGVQMISKIITAPSKCSHVGCSSEACWVDLVRSK